jgi:lipoprotein Spr
MTKSTPRNNTVKSQHPQFIDNVTVGGATNCNSIKTTIPKTENAPQPVCKETITSTDNNTVITYRNTPYTEDNFLSSKYSMILGMLPTALTNYSLYHFIEEWYGTRYRMGGHDKSGIDCSAFVQRLYEEVFGTSMVRTACDQFNSCRKIFNQSEIEEGDLVFFRIKGRRISHVGVYLANNYFVHASSSQGVMISNLNEGYWARFFAGAGKVL